MKSKLYQQHIDEAVDSVPIENGGTAARTKETACKNLGLVSKDQIRQPDGIIVLGEDGLIRKSDLPPDILNNDLPSLFGPQNVELGETVPYYITNYSSDVVYVVSVGGGTFTRDVDCIYFTAQDAATQGYIQVNARNFPLWIGSPKPMRPVILTPEEGIEQGPFTKFTSSDFIGRKSGDYHAGSEWRISTTVGFDTVVSTAEVSDLALLKAWTSTRLQRNTQYFAQVRYKGSLGGTSEWSLPHPFKTRASFIPEFYMATVGEEDYNYAARLRSVDIDSEGDRVILGDPTLDEDPNYDIGAIRIFRRTGREFVEEAVMLDNPLSLNTEIKLQIPAGGVVQMVTDSVLVGNQTYTASTVFYAPSDASYVTLVGKGADAVETQTPKPQQGLPEYPEGLPVYSAGQAAIAETGDRYYPEGLPAYVPAQLGGKPEYPDGLPVYDYWTGVGLEDYPDGLPPYDPAFPWIPQQGSADYPNGLPPYDDGQPYIAPTGNPAYPNGLPPYEPAGMVFTPGESASVSYNGQTYTFPGGQDGRATFTTVTLNFLSNQTEHRFGKEVSLSKDGKVAAASGNTFVWKGMAADLKIPPGGQIEFNVFSPNPTVETYFQDGRVAIPRDAYQVDLTGKGSPGASGTVVPGGSQTLSTSGSVSIPKGIRMITASGKGGPGSVILSPQQGLPEYPNGLPVYNAGQAYVADIGLAAYPSGLAPYDPGQAYVAPIAASYDWNTSSSYTSTTDSASYQHSSIAQAISSLGTPTGSGQSKNSGYSIQESGTYYNQYSVTATSYLATPYNPGQPYIAPKATTYYWSYSTPVFIGTNSGEFGAPIEEVNAYGVFLSQNGSVPTNANATGTFEYGVYRGMGETASYWEMYRVTATAAVNVQGTPGQPYIAPTPATYAWGEPVITQTASGVTTNSFLIVNAPADVMNTAGVPTTDGQNFSHAVATSYSGTKYKNYTVSATSYTVTTGSPGQPYIAPSGNPSYPTGLPPYVAGKPYIEPTGNPAYPDGLPPYEPPGTPQVGLPEYPNGLPVYNAGQSYIAPTGNPSYPSGLAPYDPGQAYVAPTAASYNWNTSSVYVSTTPTAVYPYSTIAQVTSAFGVPSGDGQSKNSGYSVQEIGTYYTQYTVTSVAYQVTAYNAGQPYIAPIATTYKWKYSTPIFVRSVDNGYEEPVSQGQALSTFLSANGSAPLSANSTGSYLYGEWQGGADPGGYWNEWRVTVTAVVDVQGTPGQPYIAPTDETFAWGAPTITQTATGVTSNSFAVVAAAGDAMNTAGTPTAAGQTFSRNVATSYGDTQYKNYTVSATSYTVTAGSPGQPYIAPSGNPSYPSGLPPYNAGQPYIAPTGNSSYPSGLPVYSPAGTTKLKGPDSTFTINGQSYIFPGGNGEDPVIEKSYDIALPGTAIMDGTFTIAPGGFGKVSYEDGVIPNRTVAPLNTTVTRDGSIGISRAITTLTLRGKGQDGTRTTIAAQQGLPEYPDGLPVYNAGQPYIAPSGLPEYPNGLPPYSAGQAYVAPSGNPSYPNGLPPYSPGQAYIAPTGSSSYPNGLPPYNPGQPYIAPSAAVYGWNTSESLSSTTISPSYVYNLKQQVVNSFGTPTGNGQTKSGGYSVQQSATLYNQYTVTAVAYQATAYNAGQPYIAPRATTYKWQYGQAYLDGFLEHNGDEYVPLEDEAKNRFLTANGRTPANASSSGSYVFSGGYTSGAEGGPRGWYLKRITVTAVVDVQGTPGQPYIAPTAATYAWGTPDVTMTATDLMSTALPIVTGVSDAMSTAGTPTYSGQTFTRNVATSYSGTTHKNYAVSGTSYTVTAATSGQSYIAPTGSSSYPSGLPAYNPGQAYIAPTGNASYPSGLPAYNPGQAYVAPEGNPSYPSGLPAYTAGQPYVAPVGNVSYPSGLPSYKAAIISTTSGQNTTFTINGQTYTFQGGQEGASAVSRVETVTLPGTVDQTGHYTVPTGGSIEISHYGGTISGNAVPALDADIINTGYLTFESGLTVLEVTLKGGDGDIVIVEPEQGLLQFPNGLPRYVPGSSPQVGNPGYPDGLPVYRPATAKTTKGQDSTFTINGQTYIFEGGNGHPAVERTEIIQLPGSSTLTATYSVAENVIGTVKHAAYEVWISAGYPAIARINNTIYVFPGGETGEAASTTHNVPLVGSMNVGSVSTSLRTGESWSPPTVLTPEVDQEHLHFGASISLDGTGMRMAVSAPGYDTAKGAVWVYVREDGYWKREAFLSPKDLTGSNQFGYQVCMSQDGQVLAIGAPYQDRKGAVYLYQRIKDTWYFQAKVIAEDVKRWDNFGASVSLNSDGSILAVGAPAREYQKPVYDWDPVTETNKIVYFETCSYAGAVFTFRYAEGDWIQTSELRRAESPTYPINPRNGYFGTSVSLDGSGSALVVGIPGSDGGYGGMGAVSTYIAQGGTWLFYKEVKPDTDSMSMQFSRKLRIAASGQYMIANANGWHNVNGESIHGASIVFTVEEWDTIAPPGDPIILPPGGPFTTS